MLEENESIGTAMELQSNFENVTSSENENVLTEQSTNDLSTSTEGKGPNQVEETNDDLDWFKKDKRFEGDPNKVIKAYKELETKFSSDVARQKSLINNLQKLFSENGLELFNNNNLDLDKAQQFVQEHKSLKEKYPELQQTHDYMNYWLQNPKYKELITGFFKDLETREMQELYPNMTREQIAEIEELKEFKKQQEERQHEQEMKKLEQENLNVIESSWKKIDEFSKARGFGFNQESKNKLLQHAIDNDINPKHLFATFLELFNNEIDKSYRSNIEKTILGKLEKNKQGVIISGQTKAEAPQSKSSIGDFMAKYF